MVEAQSPALVSQSSAIAAERRDSEEEEIKAEGDEVNQGLQDLLNAEEDEAELFNPQEIDFSEVERLRTRVGQLESLLSNQSQEQPAALLMRYMET